MAPWKGTWYYFINTSSEPYYYFGKAVGKERFSISREVFPLELGVENMSNELNRVERDTTRTRFSNSNVWNDYKMH